jgi:hypothetical protein
MFHPVLTGGTANNALGPAQNWKLLLNYSRFFLFLVSSINFGFKPLCSQEVMVRYLIWLYNCNIIAPTDGAFLHVMRREWMYYISGLPPLESVVDLTLSTLHRLSRYICSENLLHRRANILLARWVSPGVNYPRVHEDFCHFSWETVASPKEYRQN